MNKPITAFSFIYSIIKPYRKWYVFLCLAPIVNGVILASINYAIKIIVDTVSGDIFTWQVFAWPLGIFVIAELCSRVFWSLHDYSEYKLHGKVIKNIYIKVFEYLQNHSYSYFQNNFSGSLISKSKSIVKGFWNFWDSISHKLLESFSVIIVNIIMIGFLSVKMLIPFGISIVIIMLLAWLQSKKYARYSYKTETNVHRFLGFYSDKITNILTILNFAKKQKEIKEITDLQENTIVPIVNKMNYFNFISWVFLGTLYTTIVLCLFVYAIYLRKINIISTGTLAAIILVIYSTVREIFALVNSLFSFISSLADFRASLDGIFVKQDVIDKPNATDLKVSKGEIIFKNLSFNYDNNNTVFDNLSLHIKAGQKVGIVGHSGAGKSTLASLLLKNFKATDGDIIIDNQSIYDVSSDSLRSQISLIPQDIMLFHCTIGENIGYAKDEASQVEIENAAKLANIHEFIMTLPEKYSTLVGERGIKLSGGQRQRIAIARAILKNAPILILDEATSALDSQTEQEIQKSINTMLETNNATVIAIAHRLSTIKHLDRIIVIEGGQIVEDDNFQELLAKDTGRFKEMWEHQVNGMVV